MQDKYLEFKQFINRKSPGSEPLLIVIRGSQAYGTQLPTSDTDYSGVFIQPIEDILGFGYKEQINDDRNDTVFYELKRFLELLTSNKPNILELLNTPEDCIIYQHPYFKKILSYRDQFLTKICAKSFGGYAIQQIRKAKSQNKKQNWEKDKVTRKTPLDFCYIHVGGHSYNLREYLKKNKMSQKYCGLSKSPHGKGVYSLFYTEEFAKFKGIAFEDSNDIRLSSIPKDLPESCFVGHISYNKDEYISHCKDYKSYQTWLENKNDQRWIDVKNHDQKIDGKNMMHCRRLLEMAREIAEGKGIIVRRPNTQELIDIRKGEFDLESLIQRAEQEIKEIDELFKKSNLPDSVDKNLVNSILVDIRKKFYNLK
jgi:predicted nucleotidyltransferase